MSIFYKDGNKNSNMRINTDGKLFKWLEDNYYVDNNQLLISGDVLEAIQDQQPELEPQESVLIGHLIYNLSYNGGYIFREILSFEDKIDYIKEKHLISDDLINSEQHDIIIIVRCIEQHKEEIRNNPVFLLPITLKTFKKEIYVELCITQLHNPITALPLNVVQQAIDLCYLD